MDRALGIPELVALICSQFGTESFDALHKEESRTLAVLSRTAKMFCNPALNVLWRRQDTITNLLQCMSSDLWDIQTRREEVTDPEDPDYSEPQLKVISIVRAILHSFCGTPIDLFQRLCRAIMPEDWERVEFYSPRVRCFCTQMYDESFDTTDFFDALSLSLPIQFIFPNLEKLVWRPEPWAAFPHVRLFISPHVTELSLNCIQTLSDLAILSNLATKCPSLKSVTIIAPGFHGAELVKPILPSLSRFVCGLSRLESLSIPGLDEMGLVHLAQLRDLKYLYLGTISSDTLNPPSLHGSVTFPALSQLTVPRMDGGTSLLAWLKDCALTEITSQSSTDWPTNTLARQFYAALAAHCLHSSLREIRVWGDNSKPITTRGDWLHSCAVDGDVLKPLFCFSSLEHVSLSHPVGFDLDDSLIVDMARGWPQIISLSLISNPRRHMPSHVTLEGIYAFAQHCPSLRWLSITLDATSVPPTKLEKKCQRVAQRALTHFDVASSPIEVPRRVVKFLSAIFPQLGSIPTLYEDLVDDWGDDEEEVAIEDPLLLATHRLWKKVENSLR